MCMSFLPVASIRIALGVAGIAGALIVAPWVTLLVMIILALRYRAWEVLILGLLVDLLWFTPGSVEGFTLLPLFTFAGLALVWGFEPLRREFLIEKEDLVY